MNESEWVTGAQSGSTSDFGHLVSLYQKKLYGFLTSLTADAVMADELTQQTFLKAWQALPRFRGDSTFQTWHFQIGLNTFRSWGRTQKIRRAREWALGALGNEDGEETRAPQDTLADPRPDGDPQRTAANNALAKDLRRAVGQLPDQERAVFLLRHDQNMPLAQIAGCLELAEGTVKAHLFHALTKVRRNLEGLWTVKK